MSKIKIATIACWIVAAVTMAGLAIYFLIRGVFSFSSLGSWNTTLLSGPYDEVGSYSIPADKISNITIDWITGEIDIHVYEGSDIKITEYAQRELKDNEVLYQSAKNDTLEIRYTENTQHNSVYNIPSKKLVINIPFKLANELKNMKIESISADIYVQNIQASLIQVDTTSGEISMKEVIAADIIIKVPEAETLSVNYDTISGDLDNNIPIVTGQANPTISISTTSGNLKISDINE